MGAPTPPEELPSAVADAVRGAGVDAVGICSAEPFIQTREVLFARRREGLHAGMQFTYRNPERSTDPARSLPGARALVVAAMGYRRTDPPAPGGAFAEIARYSREDYYEPLREALAAGAAVLGAAGYAAKVLVDDNALVDRAAAVRAGLGWYGKNANVLLPGLGSWFVLGSIVTDAGLGTSPEPVADGCRTCTACLPACPTGALIAPGVLDARRCLAWLLEAPGDFPLEHRAALGGRIYGCDECQEVCPPNKVGERRSPPRPPGDGHEAWVDVVEMLCVSDAELLERFGRWYIPGREPRYLRRNALVALGNVGDGGRPAVASALTRMLEDPDPMLRRHAVWAARRLCRDDLANRCVDDDDDGVRAELHAPVIARQH